jgi:hypothetical protein
MNAQDERKHGKAIDPIKLLNAIPDGYSFTEQLKHERRIELWGSLFIIITTITVLYLCN